MEWKRLNRSAQECNWTQNKSETGGTECNDLAQKSNWGMASLESIILIAVFCVCVFVHVFVTSEISATGRRSSMLLSTTWRASPGELC